MRTVLQRVLQAKVTVDGHTVGSIGKGLLVYVGVERNDTASDVTYLSYKVPRMRLFHDEEGKMNRSLLQVQGSLLVISQFTLCADLGKGNRPSFDPAAAPDVAQALYLRFVEELRSQGIMVETGEFGAAMHVFSINEGPVTIILDSSKSMK